MFSHDENRELKVDRRMRGNVSATATFLSYPYVLNFLLLPSSCRALPKQRCGADILPASSELSPEPGRQAYVIY